MINVYIPSHHKLTDAHSSYTVFAIEVYLDDRAYDLEKRYSEFAELHKKLKKTIQTPEFPPKNVFKWQPKVIEQRRELLEIYLQTVVSSGVIPKTLATFLKIPLTVPDGISISSSDHLSEDLSPCHQPIIDFSERGYLAEFARTSLPDIVTDGVLDALYIKPR